MYYYFFLFELYICTSISLSFVRDMMNIMIIQYTYCSQFVLYIKKNNHLCNGNLTLYMNINSEILTFNKKKTELFIVIKQSLVYNIIYRGK